MMATDFLISGLCGAAGLHFRVDGFRLIYLAVAVLMWSVSGIFSLEYMAHYEKRRRYYLFFWATFAATVGVFLSADFYTTFIFFEIMSFTSYVWVAFDEKRESLKAAETYLAVAVTGGLVMLMGLFLLQNLCGTLEFEGVAAAAQEILGNAAAAGTHGAAAEGNAAAEAGSALAAGAGWNQVVQLYAAGALLLFGFGAKAGCFPLHIWLPKAHPVAPAPASALLSGILTKTGVFGVIVVSCGLFFGDYNWGLLIAVLGLVTMFWGAFLALFSINLKRTLACSSVSQIGFILTGIGMAVLLSAAGEEPVLAVRGTLLHMVNHSLFKLVLFLCAGAVYMNLHQLDLNEIRGFGRNKPVLRFSFLMGALGIGGIPLWSGYVSKTLLHESIVEYAHHTGSFWWTAAEWVFLLTGGMTVAYMTKLFVAIFVEERPESQAQHGGSGRAMRPASAAALAAAAVVIPILGMTPGLTMDRLADLGQGFFHGGLEAHAVHYFAWQNLKGGLISVGIGAVLYVLIRRFLMEDGRYVNRLPEWFDLENLVYRPVIEKALPGVCGAVCGFVDRYVIDVPVKVALAVSSVACRTMDHMADGVILLARRTTHRQSPAVPLSRREAEFQNAHRSGMARAAERIRDLEIRLRHVGGLVEESFSFGLMLFGIGLCLTIGYLLLVFFRQG